METALFETELGMFGLGWTEKGVSRLLLPGDTRAAMERRFADAGGRPADPPCTISALMDSIEDYADGEKVDFGDIALDLDAVPPFHRRAYALLLKVRWSETLTYGELARQLGDARLSRAVGQAMGANPVPLIIPCHRVLASDGRPGGFSAPGGANAKVRMLALEGVTIGTLAGQMSFGF